MVRGRVDVAFEEVTRDHVAVVDKDGPDLDDDEEDEEEVFVHREDECRDVVREGLCVAVDRVEGEGGPRRWHCERGCVRARIETIFHFTHLSTYDAPCERACISWDDARAGESSKWKSR